MPKVTVSQPIDAPAEVVFRAISDIADLPKTNPDILSIEFLTEQRVGRGPGSGRRGRWAATSW